MISVAIAANLAFTSFEIGLLLDGLRRENPFWEQSSLYKSHSPYLAAQPSLPM